VGWLAHDVVVHPITGMMLFAAKTLDLGEVSLRLAAVAHRIHNASSPANDAMADYAEAAVRAGQNETFRRIGDHANCWVCGDPGWGGKMRVVNGRDLYPDHYHISGMRCPSSGQDLTARDYNEQRKLAGHFVSATITFAAVKEMLNSPEFLDELAKAVAKHTKR
jgi:hypothetical protein